LNTLIFVHRRQLMDQWSNASSRFHTCRTIRSAKDAQFVLGRKRAATRTLDELRD